MTANIQQDERWMALAIELAARGRGSVEPNPLVGAVVVRDGVELSRGWHQKFGHPHAEIEALKNCADPRGATVYVNLEPCCHHGKTPPCTEALIAAAISRVVVANADPFAQVSGKGFQQLQAAGIAVTTEVLSAAGRRLNAPYFKRLGTGMPWVIAKWAMSLDGKMAAASGDSKWISNEASRANAHAIRGRVDAIVVGRQTALVDNPLLTARPAGPRRALRIVLDSQLTLSLESQLVRTAHEFPLLVAGVEGADSARRGQLESAGAEVLLLPAVDSRPSIEHLLQELGRRQATNVLVEGGSQLLGSFFDSNMVDEAIAYIAPTIIGGQSAAAPIIGTRGQQMHDAVALSDVAVTRFGDDISVRGLVVRKMQ